MRLTSENLARGVVAVCSVSAVLWMFPPRAAPLQAWYEPTFHVDFYVTDQMHEMASLEDPLLTEVYDYLSPVLAAIENATTAREDVAAALVLRYQNAVEEVEYPLGYKAVWCEDIGEVKIVWCDAVSFFIDTRAGSITVDVEETVVLRKG